MGWYRKGIGNMSYDFYEIREDICSRFGIDPDAFTKEFVIGVKKELFIRRDRYPVFRKLAKKAGVGIEALENEGEYPFKKEFIDLLDSDVRVCYDVHTPCSGPDPSYLKYHG